MPEILEVESYRVLAEQAALGRVVADVMADDDWYLKGPPASVVVGALEGRMLTRARRRGKLLLLDTSEGGPVLGLRFGMTGRLIVDGRAAVDRLLYAPIRSDRRYERFGLRFADGGDLHISDPRRLGGVELDPDESRLGPDAIGLTLAQLRQALAPGRALSQAPLKSRLLDQSRVAGVGNLLADEMLWRAGLAPERPTGSLSDDEIRQLHRSLAGTLRQLGRRGGSHTGDLMAERHPGGVCPRDGAPLRVVSVGGRTTWWCPAHQR